MAVVDGLDAAAGGCVVFGRRDFELAVIGERPDALHKALAIGACADDGGAVHVLQGAGNDLRGRSRPGIDQNDKGDPEVHRIAGGLVHLAGPLDTSLGSDDDGPFRDEEGHDVHSLVHRAAPISAKVQHQPLHSLGLERVIPVFDPLSHTFGELGHEDIPRRVVQHVHVFDGGEGDAFPGHGNLDGFAGLPGGASAQLFHAEQDLGARLPAHLLGGFLAGEPMGGHAVDRFDLVAAAKARLGGRGAGIGLVDQHVPIHVALVDDGADAPVGVGEHHLEVFLLFFRDIDGVRVEGLQHGVHALPLDPSDFQGIDIGAVQFLEDGIVEFDPFAQGETLGLGRGGGRDGKGREDRKNVSGFVHNRWSFTHKGRANPQSYEKLAIFAALIGKSIYEDCFCHRQSRKTAGSAGNPGGGVRTGHPCGSRYSRRDS